MLSDEQNPHFLHSYLISDFLLAVPEAVLAVRGHNTRVKFIVTRHVHIYCNLPAQTQKTEQHFKNNSPMHIFQELQMKMCEDVAKSK